MGQSIAHAPKGKAYGGPKISWCKILKITASVQNGRLNSQKNLSRVAQKAVRKLTRGGVMISKRKKCALTTCKVSLKAKACVLVVVRQ